MFSSDQQYSVDRLSTSTNKQHEFGLGSQLTNKNLLSPPNVTVAHKQYSFHIKDDATYATHKRKTKLSQEPRQDTFNHINGDGTTQRTLCPSKRDNDDVDNERRHRPSLRPSERLTQPHENEASNSDRQESSIITKGADKSRKLPNHKGCQKRGGTITPNRKARRNNHIEHAIERVC